ncbi:hypothetical protein BKA66DRAFT_564328 [Pyrenochaeta sp. MPI-SDFR-AT-0127]|nr:hypothetical protein BKA66DRAFT_564328 [Pyrenochaeta sp. MPI-SDFR-AT-0127]
MAEAIGIIASALTIGASAAQLSLALFSVAQTLKNAPDEIADIAEEIHLLSHSFQSLADILDAHQNLCKPALFRNTKAILWRYNQVETELKKLIATPTKLARLRWGIKKPKAKGLLKKIEGIKTALVLQLNIIHLAREEGTRPYTNTSTTAQLKTTPKSNRFRKIVESAVQANRQVVESAQREVAEASTWQKRSFGAQIDVWKEDSFDTATWLYHLVFNTEVTPSPTPSPPSNRLYQASVTDETPGNPDQIVFPASGSAAMAGNISASADKAIIVWNRQTEPSLVADRLLFSWTTLSAEQISLSSTRHDGDEWREGFLKMIEEANEVEEHEEPVLGEWRHQVDGVESDDEDFQSAEEESVTDDNTATHQANRPFETNDNINSTPYVNPFNYLDEWDERRESPVLDRLRRPAVKVGMSQKPKNRRPLHDPHVKWQTNNPSTDRSKAHASQPSRYTDLDAGAEASRHFGSVESRVHTILSDQASTPPKGNSVQSGYSDVYPNYTPSVGYPNPFESGFAPQPSDYGYLPPGHNPFSIPPLNPYPRGPPHFNGPPIPPTIPEGRQWSAPPPAAAPSPPLSRPEKAAPVQFVASSPPETVAKENTIIALISSLLEKRGPASNHGAEDPRFSRLEQLLIAQQERDAQAERDNAKAATEAQLKQIFISHEKDHERIKQLEKSNVEQREERRAAEAIWREERAALVENATRQTQEAKDFAAREIAAAHSAIKSAQKSLELAKADAEKRAKDEADAKAAREKRRIEDDHKQRIQRFEEQIREFQTQRSVPAQDSQRPVRRTCMSDGNRSIDVTEYTTDKHDSIMPGSFSPFKFFQEGMSRIGTPFERKTGRNQSQRSRHDSFRSSAASLHSSRASIETMSTSDTAQKLQQMIVFPSKVDRGSVKISQMQTSLANSGVGTVFEDPEEVEAGQIVRYDDMDEQVVRSTIFWEAPVLSLGSELLLTMRRAGWRPAYTRSSDAGQTYFLGSQPVHSYFFRPDYKPQFSPSPTASPTNCIIIDKGLVEEYALIELGFQFQSTNVSTYILDGRLTFSDIEVLVERSFLMKENNFRRLHRQLQWHYNNSSETAQATHRTDYEGSLASDTSVSVAGSCSTCTDADANTETESEDTSTVADEARTEISNVDQYLVPDSEGSEHSANSGNSEDGGVSAFNRDDSSINSPSAVSHSSSKSTNPFRRHMVNSTLSRSRHDSPQSTAQSIWDDPNLH